MVEEASDEWWRSCRQGCNMAVDCGGGIDVSVQINCTSSPPRKAVAFGGGASAL